MVRARSSPLAGIPHRERSESAPSPPKLGDSLSTRAGHLDHKRSSTLRDQPTNSRGFGQSNQIACTLNRIRTLRSRPASYSAVPAAHDRSVSWCMTTCGPAVWTVRVNAAVSNHRARYRARTSSFFAISSMRPVYRITPLSMMQTRSASPSANIKSGSANKIPKPDCLSSTIR